MNPTKPIVDNFAYSLDFLRELIADLSPSQMVSQPEGIANHPSWVMGHLIFSCQAIGGEIGLPRWLSENWGTRYGMRSVPVDDENAYESKQVLQQMLLEAEARLVEAIEKLTIAQLEEPLPDENYRDKLPTTHHAIGQIVIAHTAYHIGQTVLWRKLMQLPPIDRPFL